MKAIEFYKKKKNGLKKFLQLKKKNINGNINGFKAQSLKLKNYVNSSVIKIMNIKKLRMNFNKRDSLMKWK